MIDTIALFAILVIDHRVAEVIDVTAGLPCRGMHKDGGIDPYNILVELCHAFPPMILDILLELTAVLTIVIDSAQSVIDLAGREDKTVFLTMRNDRLKLIGVRRHRRQR